MPLDIEIDDKLYPKQIQLGVNDFNVILDKIKILNNCPILARSLSNYFGDSEIYLDELNFLKEEILRISKSLKDSKENSALPFLNDFLSLTETAIKNRKTIKFIGD